MTDVISFPCRRDPEHYMLIDAGTVTGPPGHQHIGAFRYFVSVVTRGHEPLCVWDGTSVDDAVAQAVEWDLPIVNGIIDGGAA